MKNRQEEELLHLAEAISEDILQLESVEVEAAYERIRLQRRKNAARVRWQRLTRYAAILAFPLLLTSLTLAYLYFRAPLPAEETYAQVMASAGGILRYELPDGSVAWLNAGSTLRFPVRFSTPARRVELRGEGYFEVTADEASPFYVDTPSGVSVYVYGTRFNISAYDEDSLVEAALEEGKVHVLLPDGRQPYPLSPGEFLSYEKQTGQTHREAVDIYEKISWREGKLIFRNTSLAQIFRRLERHFNVDIRFTNHSGKEYKYRATFRHETLPQILDYLGKSANLKWRAEESEQQADGTLTQKIIFIDLY